MVGIEDLCSAQVHIDKGVISAADLTAMIQELESYGSRGLGPRIIARAWVDPAFKARLLKDGMTACKELGIESDGWPPGGGVTGCSPPITLKP